SRRTSTFPRANQRSASPVGKNLRQCSTCSVLPQAYNVRNRCAFGDIPFPAPSPGFLSVRSGTDERRAFGSRPPARHLCSFVSSILYYESMYQLLLVYHNVLTIDKWHWPND